MQLDLPQVAQSLDFTCGAACFESMYRYFNNFSLGEMHFANELGSIELGYTPPENIVKLARGYGLICDLKEGAALADLRRALTARKVVFVTWWDESSGHYSLVKSLDDLFITLMDPWTARKGADNRMALDEFIPNWRARGAVVITAAPRLE